jgi:hypothetical protein
MLAFFAVMVAIMNIVHSPEGGRLAYATGGIGGLLLLPAIALLMLKRDAAAGFAYLLGGIVILSAAPLLNAASGRSWEDFSWMYVCQAMATMLIGIPAIRASLLDYVLPHSEFDPKSIAVIGVRGWLLFLCIVLTIISPAFSMVRFVIDFVPPVTSIFNRYDVVEMPHVLTIPVLIVSLVVLRNAFSIYAGIALWTRRPNAVWVAKLYLSANLVVFGLFLSPLLGSLYDFVDPDRDYDHLLFSPPVRAFLAAFGSWALWTAYLTWSRRVRATFPAARLQPSARAIRSCASIFDLETYGAAWLVGLAYGVVTIWRSSVIYVVWLVRFRPFGGHEMLIWHPWEARRLAILACGVFVKALLFVLVLSKIRSQKLLPFAWGLALAAVVWLNVYAWNTLVPALDSIELEYGSGLPSPSRWACSALITGIMEMAALVLTVRLAGLRLWSFLLGFVLAGVVSHIANPLTQLLWSADWGVLGRLIDFEGLIVRLLAWLGVGAILYLGIVAHISRKESGDRLNDIKLSPS